MNQTFIYFWLLNMQIIGKTMEWKRINALPLRRSFDQQQQLYKDLWTRFLKVDQSDQSLNFYQALLIDETVYCHGSIGCIGVGGGKSFIAPLIPIALNADRPLLIVPASLKKQMVDSVIPDHIKNSWKIHPNLRIDSYHWISSIDGAKFLEEYQPDLIICDEVHKLKNPQSARTKRVLRFFKHFPSTVFVGLSGTITKDSIKDYYHLFKLALRDRSPLPNNYQEIELWDLVLSPKADNQYFEKVNPGVLFEWDSDPRKGYQRKITNTPGIIITPDQPCNASINISLWTHKHESPELLNCREKWELPNGEIICDSLVYYQKARQLSNGFYYDYKEQPPDEWLEKKRAWYSLARSMLRYNKFGLDTLGQLELHAQSMPLTHVFPEYIEWKAIERSFKPETVLYFFDTSIIKSVLDFIYIQLDQHFLIWTDSVAIGKMFEWCGIKYFGGGDDKELLWYFDQNQIPNQPVVLSIKSHSEGKNLQRFHKAIIITPPNSGDKWEQIIGREHRIGQQSDEIEVFVCAHTQELQKSFDHALIDARYIQTTTGQKQKLLMATIV